MLRAIRKIFGDAKAELSSGYIVVGNSEGYASNVPLSGDLTIDPAGSVTFAASAIAKADLKYAYNVFSLKGDAAISLTATISTTGGILGMYLTKITSYANLPILTKAANSIAVSVAQALVGSDVCEGVVITIE